MWKFFYNLIKSFPDILKEREDYPYLPWFKKVYLYVYLFIYTLYLVSPYKTAITCLAYIKYKNTTMYHKRLINFGEDFTLQQYINNNEQDIFLNKLTWKDRLKAIFLPFSCMED